MNLYSQSLPNVSYGGRCTRCGGVHALRPSHAAIAAARSLAERIRAERRIDFDAPPPGDPRFTTAHLDGTKGPGRMLGVLIATAPPSPSPLSSPQAKDAAGSDATGNNTGAGSNDGAAAAVVVLKAFSGQMTETWRVPGWAGPLHAVTSDTSYYREVRAVTERVTARIDALCALQRRREEVAEEGHAAAAEAAAAAAATGAAPAVGEPPLPAQQQQPQKQQQTQKQQKQQKQRQRRAASDPWIADQIARLKARRRGMSHHLLERVQRSYLTADCAGAPLDLLQAYLEASERFGPFPTTKPTAAGGGGSSSSDGSGTDSGGGGGFVGFPAGCGDCAAPKLLAAAARAGLRPAALVEFFYGAPPGTATPRRPPITPSAAGDSTASSSSLSESSNGDGGSSGSGDSSGGGGATRRHGFVYGPCEKCAAVLGTMLHGLGSGSGSGDCSSDGSW